MVTMEELLDISKQISEKESILFGLRTSLEETKKSIDEKRAKTYVYVTNLKGSDGKPTYSNERLRENAIEDLLAAEKEYQKLIETLKRCQFLLSEDTINVEHLKRVLEIKKLFVKN